MPSRISDDFLEQLQRTTDIHRLRWKPYLKPGAREDANQIREYPVRFTDLDLFDHMNNAVYWSVIEDYLSTTPGLLKAPLRVTIEHETPVALGDKLRSSRTPTRPVRRRRASRSGPQNGRGATGRRLSRRVRAPGRCHRPLLERDARCRMITPAEIAKQLIAAERERVAIAPFTDANPELDIATAYLAQRAFVQAKLDAGEQVIGAKLGLTSKVKQQAMGVDAPLSGVVTSGMLAPFGVPIELSEFIHPRVEPEIAFVLARDVAAPATVSSVLAATESVYGAIDVLDSRYEDFRFALPDVIADNASAARFLVGPRSVVPGDLEDLRLLGCVLRADGDVVATAAGAAVMGHPAASVAWLANQLAERGEMLKAGWTVFSGGLTAPIPLSAGSSVTAEFDGLGTVEVFTG